MEQEMKYPLVDDDSERLERDFVYHAPKDDQPARYERIREEAKAFAKTILTNCPQSRERARALSALEDAVFCANAAIARNE